MAKADLCIWSSEASRWTELSPNGTLPSPRFEHTMVWSQADAAIYVFGGFEDGGVLNDLHRYEPLENEWNLLSPGGSVPPVRYQHSMVSAGVLYMFGGSSWSSGGWKNDLYIYEPQTITTTTQTGTTQ
ncbi:KEL2, partial [Symbiodinium sp. KB8]